MSLFLPIHPFKGELPFGGSCFSMRHNLSNAKNLFFSMGVGEFLSSKATNEWILSERRREEWEMENYPEGEIREMIDIYKQKGMSHEDAKLVIETMAKYKDFFVDVMMSEELELQVRFCFVFNFGYTSLPSKVSK